MKKKTYQIEVEEVLYEVYPIKANSLSEALAIADEKYYNQEIILEPGTLKKLNFRQFKDKTVGHNYKRKSMER